MPAPELPEVYAATIRDIPPRDIASDVKAQAVKDAQGKIESVTMPVDRYEQLLHCERDLYLVRCYLVYLGANHHLNRDELGAPFGLDRHEIAGILGKNGVYVYGNDMDEDLFVRLNAEAAQIGSEPKEGK